MRVVLGAVLTGSLLLLLAGCRPTTEAPAGAAGGQVSTQQQQQMEQILDYMKEKDTSLDSLRQEIDQLRAQESDPGGVKALSEDVRAARLLVTTLRTAVGGKTTVSTESAMNRLQACLISLRANLPAARMAQDLERALQALASYSPQDAQNAASRDVLQATDLATKAPATLVPTVIKDLESAKDQVDKLNPAAKASLLETLKRISADDSLQSADHVLAAAQMTRTALDLGAPPVVTAELDYMDQVLAGLQQKIEGALAPVTPEQAATGEAAAVPATGEAAATPEAEAVPAPAPAPAPPVAPPAPRHK